MRVFSSLLLLALAVPAVAQEPEIRSANLPPAVEWELIRMFDGGAERMDGPAVIEADRIVPGNLAVHGGPFRLAGRIEGDLAMVGGDVILEPGSSVAGSITVVGGEVRLEGEAEVAGTITAYALGRDWDRDDWDDDDWDRDRDRSRDHWWRRDRRQRWGDGYARLDLRIGSGYNRVEGLPILFGPTLRTAGSNPLRLSAYAIWRSESESLETDRMGYRVEAEQFFAGRALSVGGSVYSVIQPLDAWQISDVEASFAAALFHDDYRDYYDRTGWSAFVRASPASWLEARVEYRQEEHDAVAAADPWSLFDGDDLWRHQPLVGEGDLQTVVGSIELDLRDDEVDPYRGWYARAEVVQPVGGELTRPLLFGDHPDNALVSSYQLPAEELGTDFTAGYIDLRHYAPVSRSSQLNLRIAAGGNLSEGALPSQFQHALGGIGTLPGFATFQADCGARAFVGRRGVNEYYPGYGCDRFALGQVEYRGDLSLYFGWGDADFDDDWWDYMEVDIDPTWVVFFDAAHGWAYEDALGPDRDTGLLYDAGVGFLLDDLGVYMALPLNGDVEQEPRFFVRLGRRF